MILQYNAASPLHILRPSQDADGDGMPDDWEEFHDLDSASAGDATGDSDGDGISNLSEFQYRTDPHLITVHSNGRLIDLRPGDDTDGDGMLNLWEWENGLSFDYAGDAEADSDGDGLSNYQEFLLGLLPRNWDSDGDGVSDSDETQVNMTNPLTAVDADQDSIPDDLELHLSKQFLSVQPDPLVWGAKYAGLQAGNLDPGYDYTGESVTAQQLADFLRSGVSSSSGYLIEPYVRIGRISAQHQAASGSVPAQYTGRYMYHIINGAEVYEDLTPGSPFNLTSLSSHLVARTDAVAWVAPITNEKGGPTAEYDEKSPEIYGHALSGITQVASPSGNETNYLGYVHQRKFRVGATRADHSGFTRVFIKVTRSHPIYVQAISQPGEGDFVSAESVTIAIPKGKIFSDWFEADVEMENGKYTTSHLIPVEIEQQDYSPSQGIRFCRWLDSFAGDDLNSDCADEDRDRFRIRIPGVVPNLTKIHIKSYGLATAVINGGWESKYTDGGYDVTMTEENGATVSKWMLLVSDGDDDVDYNGVGTDNGTDDQTLLANFNSPIQVTLPEFQNAKVTFHAQKPLGDLEIQPYYLSPDGNVGPGMELVITNRLEKMKEIYRQIGVRVSYYGIVGKTVPQSWFDAGPNEPANHLTKSETLDAAIVVSQAVVPAERIRVGFVDATLMAGDGWGGPVAGLSPLGSDPVIVSVKQGDERRILAVTAHEVGHALGLDHLEQVEPAQYHPVPRRWLMRNAGDGRSIWADSGLDTKRFQSGDFEIIRNSNFFHVPD